MPPYLQRLSDSYAPPPYRAAGATFSAFALDVGYEPLTNLLAGDLGTVAPQRTFLPVLPYALVTYVAIERSSSLSAVPSHQGWYAENDLMVWVLAAAFAQGSMVPRIGWYVPLVWVDQAIAVVEGREGFGYPKSLATVTIPPPATASPVFSTMACVFPGDPDDPVTVESINVVSPGAPPAEPSNAAAWHTAQDAVAGFAAVASPNPQAHVFDDRMPPVNLHDILAVLPQDIILVRQLADPAAPGQAQVQQLLVSPVQDLTFHGGGLLPGAWTVDFPTHPTLDVNGLLGLSGPTASSFAYQITIDCTLGTPTPW